MPITPLIPTYDQQADRLAQLRALFPEAWADGALDWDALRDLLGAADEAAEGEGVAAERFGLFWPGKRAARRAAALPPAASLAPAPGEGVNEATTRNLFIEGDNLEVLKLLRKAYAGQVKMIYIDPPYNTGNDFVYKDDFSESEASYLQRTGQMDNLGRRLTTNTKASGRFHANWLSMMYPRLVLARELLHEDGVIFVSIDDGEVQNLRQMVGEIFGEENAVATLIWKRSYGGGPKEKYIVIQHEYILCYARDLSALSDLWLPPDPEVEKRYYRFSDDRGPYRVQPLEAGKSMDSRPNLVFPVPLPSGGEVWPKRQWLWNRERMMNALQKDELVFTGEGDSTIVSYKQYLINEDGEKRGTKPVSIVDGIYTQHGTASLVGLFDDDLVMQFPKPVELIKRLLSIGTIMPSKAIVLDFFAGSCTTAQAVLELNREDGGNRRFIMVQLPEPTGREDYATIAEIGKERIRRVIARMAQEADQAGQLALPTEEGNAKGAPGAPQDLGFKVFKVAPSCLRPWRDYQGASLPELQQQMAALAAPLVEGWRPEHLRTIVLLQEGFPLDSRAEQAAALAHNRVERIASDTSQHALWLCLDGRIAAETVAALPAALAAQDVFVCLDSALTDEAKVRLEDRCNVRVI